MKNAYVEAEAAPQGSPDSEQSRRYLVEADLVAHDGAEQLPDQVRVELLGEIAGLRASKCEGYIIACLIIPRNSNGLACVPQTGFTNKHDLRPSRRFKPSRY